LTKEQALDFMRWMISEVATRPAARGRKTSSPLVGKHSSRPIQPGFFWALDVSERVYFCFAALIKAGDGSDNAANELQIELNDRIGQSKRGGRESTVSRETRWTESERWKRWQAL
jgi:hypothetical protein